MEGKAVFSQGKFGTRTDSTGLRDLFLLRPDVVFLNHGSFGACPQPVFETYQRWQRELERQPVEFLGRRFASLMRTAREALASYVHTAPEDLVYVPNATTGLNVVARSLPLQPGDEVLATDHEYGALNRTWRFVCAKRNATYVNYPLPLPIRSAEQVVETIWAGVTPRTRVLFISQYTSPTALILPVAELVRRARQAGILTVVDGAHMPGQIPLDLTALGADFYAGNLHKWLCAPKGAGFLNARREVQLGQRIDRLGLRVEDVDHPLVRLQLELLTRLLVDVRRAKDGPALRLRGKRDRSGDLGPRLLRGPHDVRRSLVDHGVIERLQSDANTSSH